MTISPLAFAESLHIGIIDFVSPDEIKVLLDIEAPDSMALNTGTPRPFPRINSYVLIPGDQGYLVGQVEWITIERSQYPKRKGMQDFGLVDLPYPLRKMRLNPLGTLSYEGVRGEEEFYVFRRGVESYPAVGDAVLLPTQGQLKAIIESGENRRVKIGISPLAANAEVKIDPDRLFGRHLAVLGNTGSGKSCSVAGLVRWSLEAAKKARNGEEPNARFIVLDPNGEYAQTFQDLGNVNIFAVEPGEGAEQLQVPLWFWNSAEWCAFAQASSKTQRPTLIQALRTVRDGTIEPSVAPSHDMRRYLRTLVSILRVQRNTGKPWAQFPHPKNFYELLLTWERGLATSGEFSQDENNSINAVISKLSVFKQARQGQHPKYEFTKTEVDELLGLIQTAHSAFGGSDTDTLPIDADIPREFTGEQLLRSVEANAEIFNVSDHVETMLIRIRTILSDNRIRNISGGDSSISLSDWLAKYIGDNEISIGSVSVVDLSLIPAEVVHIVTAVIARMTLESLQRYRRLKSKILPTVLIMEEAHTFIKRYKDDSDVQNAAAVCCQVFEKIAREGRKFGLGLVLSSQRPSELSQTVLSQCNTFLLHRISNDKDQDLVHKLVPDNLRGLLRDLPSLPSRHAVLLGWASELPVIVQMSALPEAHRPKSDDPDFWAVWSGKDEQGNLVERSVDWKEIADDWQQNDSTGTAPTNHIPDNGER